MSNAKTSFIFHLGSKKVIFNRKENGKSKMQFALSKLSFIFALSLQINARYTSRTQK